MRDSLEKCGLVLSLPKTHLCFALGDLELSCKTWPRWGIMLDGELSELGMSVRHINETECGSWPTPTTRDYKGARGKAAQERKGNPLDTIPNVLAYGGTQTPQVYLTPQANEDAAGTPAGKMQKMLGNSEVVRGKTPEEWKKGTLNPPWVEWLMGWPIGWTDLKPLVTDKLACAQPWHSIFSQKD
jgi:hypothetical protein